jgi:hypothetical protein
MVFRQLQLGIVVAALLGSACGEEGNPTSTSIEMEIDDLSCFTDAQGLTLSCTSTAIVAVLNQRGETIAGDCATLPAGRLIDSAQVIEDTLSLGTLPSDTPLTIGLSIHSGVLSPCPQANASSSAFLSGTTPLVTLSEQSSGIPLLLRCSNITGPGVPSDSTSEACEDCDGDLQFCLASSALSSCDSLFLDCEMDCFNAQDPERCFLSCQQLAGFCTNSGNGVVLNCTDDPGLCFDSCEGDIPPDLCGEACSDATQQCINYQQLQSQCNDQFQSCLSDCGGSSSCLSLGF